MTDKQFLIRAIKRLCKKIKGIQVKYAYEESIAYNLVVITPDSVYTDPKCRKEVYKVWSEFMKKFPNSDLIISDPDESYDMSNCLFDSTTQTEQKACD